MNPENPLSHNPNRLEALDGSLLDNLVSKSFERSELNVQLGESFQNLIRRANSMNYYQTPEGADNNTSYRTVFSPKLTDKLSAVAYIEVDNRWSDLVGTDKWLIMSRSLRLELHSWMSGFDAVASGEVEEEPEIVELQLQRMDGHSQGAFVLESNDGLPMSNDYVKAVIQILDSIAADGSAGVWG